MNNKLIDNLYIALIHYPVSNKKGDSITSALTSIDMHDIARASMTFGVRGFYVVTPLMDQQVLAHELIDHWTEGIGGKLNPFRKMALELIRVVSTFEESISEIKAETHTPVLTVATSADNHYNDNIITVPQLCKKLNGNKHHNINDNNSDNKNHNASYLVTFGTAWGMSEQFIKNCDFILKPIYGLADYNHLSVRSAVSIILDRICRNFYDP